MIPVLAPCCVGLDVHKEIIVSTVLQTSPEGDLQKTIKEFGMFYTDLQELTQWLGSYHPDLIVMESTGIYWQQVYEHLEKADLPAQVVNARHVKKVPGRKTDVQDSEWLAELGRCGLLKPSFIPAGDFRTLRSCTRYRIKLVRMLGAEKNRLQKTLESCGIKLSSVVSNIDGVSARLMIEALCLNQKQPEDIVQLAKGQLKRKSKELMEALKTPISDRHRMLMQYIQSHIRWLERQINILDEQIVAAMVPYQEQFQLLQTIPGIDQIAAAMLLAELSIDISAFHNQHHLCSWAGLIPGQNQSAGKRKPSRAPKGNQYIRQLLCECANSAIKTNSQFKAKYRSLVIRRGHKRSVMAIAHKLLQVIYIILKRKEPYKDPNTNYEELMVQRNAPRWIKALQKFGYWPKEQKTN